MSKTKLSAWGGDRAGGDGDDNHLIVTMMVIITWWWQWWWCWWWQSPGGSPPQTWLSIQRSGFPPLQELVQRFPWTSMASRCLPGDFDQQCGNWDDDDGHPENEADLGQDQLKRANVDVIDVPHAELPVEVFGPQQLQVRHHELPQLQNVVPWATCSSIFYSFPSSPSELGTPFNDNCSGSKQMCLDCSPEQQKSKVLWFSIKWQYPGCKTKDQPKSQLPQFKPPSPSLSSAPEPTRSSTHHKNPISVNIAHPVGDKKIFGHLN